MESASSRLNKRRKQTLSSTIGPLSDSYS